MLLLTICKNMVGLKMIVCIRCEYVYRAPSPIAKALDWSVVLRLSSCVRIYVTTYSA